MSNPTDYRPEFKFNPDTQAHEIYGPSFQRIMQDVLLQFQRDIEGKTEAALVALGWLPPARAVEAYKLALACIGTGIHGKDLHHMLDLLECIDALRKERQSGISPALDEEKEGNPTS